MADIDLNELETVLSAWETMKKIACERHGDTYTPCIVERAARAYLIQSRNKPAQEKRDAALNKMPDIDGHWSDWSTKTVVFNKEEYETITSLLKRTNE